MRAERIRFVGPREIVTETVDVPDPRPGEVMVRTEYSGISGGTELLAYRGELDPQAPLDETLGSLDGGPRIAETAVVLGLGVVGILTGALLHRAGAEVIGSDPDGFRREVAESFGLRAVDPDGLRASVEAATGGRGVGLCVEA